jgi:predicted nucleic acid-binding protein
LKVCDSSYLVKAILEDESLIRGEQFVAPDIIIFEVANVIWKHECLIRNLDDGTPYLTSLYDLIKSGKINVLSPNETLMQKSYLIAKQNSITIYDAVFIALALQLGVSMKTLDKAQIRAFKLESNK